MVTETQRMEIKRRMTRIKDAQRNGADDEVIKQRTAELYQYLEAQGIINPFDE